MKLTDDVRFVRGIGPKKAELLHKLGIDTLADAVQCYPRGYEDRTAVVPIFELLDGENAVSMRLSARSRKQHISERAWTSQIAACMTRPACYPCVFLITNTQRLYWKSERNMHFTEKYRRKADNSS